MFLDSISLEVTNPAIVSFDDSPWVRGFPEGSSWLIAAAGAGALKSGVIQKTDMMHKHCMMCAIIIQ